MKAQTLTIKMPGDLKQRLQRQADQQGVSVNQLTNYLLTIQLTQLETLSALETRLTRKTLPDLRAKVTALLDNIPDRDVPEWDAQRMIADRELIRKGLEILHAHLGLVETERFIALL